MPDETVPSSVLASHQRDVDLAIIEIAIGTARTLHALALSGTYVPFEAADPDHPLNLLSSICTALASKDRLAASVLTARLELAVETVPLTEMETP